MLTGTPVVQDDTDLFAQFRFLNPKIFGKTWGDFKDRYCRRVGNVKWNKWKLRPGLRKKLFYKLIKPHQYKLKLSEAMPELPETMDLTLEFELTGHSARAYEEMESNYYLEFGGYEFANDLAVVNMLRLQELTGGFLDNGEQVIELEQNKLQTMVDWLSDFPKNKKVVIFARFTEEINAIAKAMKRMGRSYCILDGKTPNKNIWRDFQYKKLYDTFIAQISSGSLGIELSVADIIIFFSRTFSFTDYSQARARPLGPNQKSCVLFVHLIGKKTIDIDIDTSLNKKCETSNDVHKRLKRRRYKMAKKKTKEKKKPTPPPFEKPDFGVAELAEELGITPTVCRQRLRAAGIEKSGRTYDFKNKKGVKEVASQLKSDSKPKKEKTEKKKKKKKK
jgi:SNF2 family DNA or RNA helicase